MNNYLKYYINLEVDLINLIVKKKILKINYLNKNEIMIKWINFYKNLLKIIKLI